MRRTAITVLFLGVMFLVNLSWADDPNEFNQIMGLSVTTAGTQSVGDCGWEESLSRVGSDGGQLTITINTCPVVKYEITSFPQTGGAGGTAELEPDDLIIVWDEDAGHGEIEDNKNFSYSIPDGFIKIEKSEYENYLELTSTQPSVTNWAVYKAVTAGTFTKGNAGTNEHEVINLKLNIVQFIKFDDVNDDPNYPTCIGLDQTFVYTIQYGNPTSQTFYDTYIVDFLDSGVEFLYEIIDGQPVYQSEPDPNLLSDPNFWACLNDPNCTWPAPAAAGSPGVYDDGAVIWSIGTIAPGASGSVSFVVRVNDQSNPLVRLHNVAEMWDDTRRLGYAEEFTKVCPWDMGGIIYVDIHAPAGGNGTSWDLAYNDLQEAIERINFVNDPNILYEVRIADGPYNPGSTYDQFMDAYTDTFILPTGSTFVGGYAGYGAANPDERNISKYKTILTGYIRENARNNTVVKLNDGCLLDGCTVEEGVYGINGSNASSTIRNCTIRNNQRRGVTCENGNIDILWCQIESNGEQGAWHRGSGYSLTCINSKIFFNEWDGIRIENSLTTILNSLIYENGSASSQLSSYYGVNLVNPSGNPTIRNCTIAQNALAGIRRVGGSVPKVKNCVLFYNDSQDGFTDLEGITATWHCCLTDPNAPETVINNPTPDSYGNIVTHPRFAYTTEPNNLPPAGNYHLAYDSPCVNMGDPNETGIDELDMDGELRESGTIDIGADEMTACGSEPWDIAHPLDFSADGVINMVEYAAFASSWLVSDANELFNPRCDLNEDNFIDLADFAEFCDAWLWTACWRLDLQQLLTQQMMMMSFDNAAEDSGFKCSAVIPAQECHPGVRSGVQMVQREPTIDEQILQLQDTIAFLEQIWLEEPDLQRDINPEDWQDFIRAVHHSLSDLQAESIQM